MDTQNVSAQLYNKQLNIDSKDGKYGCKDTYPYLSTCVNDTESDNNIENAFQQQLDLSEYYKSPNVFNSIKDSYMDKTMENETKEEPPQPEPPQPEPPQPPPTVQQFTPVRQRFTPSSPKKETSYFGKKSRFGKMCGCWFNIVIGICILLALIILMYKLK